MGRDWRGGRHSLASMAHLPLCLRGTKNFFSPRSGLAIWSTVKRLSAVVSVPPTSSTLDRELTADSARPQTTSPAATAATHRMATPSIIPSQQLLYRRVLLWG